ncbi:MAG: hypothetical protein HXX12_03900 [Geothrix sp.]|uniref:hypothetical protein n=1 Tax=Geothrix sp. TaxID=1962974 RepID=UPI00181B39B3|nr:hypothetical protein [Geothrix sp.]NWJ40101.1 hypothetical protein [Geothrix sp.]WIL21890.1 MAG: hypothetical protein QOZ81_001170 [Geothrix sp.]
MTASASRASGLTLLTALGGFILGCAAAWLGVAEGSVALWGFGAACLLQVPPALSLRQRVRAGLGNSGLERERLTLKSVSFLLRLLALGMGMASISALLGERAPQAGVLPLGLAILAVGCLAFLWRSKIPLAGLHPALALDADRARTLSALAALLLAASLLGRWFPWADASVGLVMAVGLFLEGRTMGKGTTLASAACGGGCGGCG